MKRTFCITALLLICSFSSFAIDNEFEAAANTLCEKQKQCALNSVEGENMPPEMKQLMMASINSICVSMRASFDAQGAKTEKLLKPATVCMNSIINLSCEAMEKRPETTECKQLETLYKQ